jgi:hypothetical protein
MDRGSWNRSEIQSLNTTADLSKKEGRQKGQIVKGDSCSMGYGMS